MGTTQDRCVHSTVMGGWVAPAAHEAGAALGGVFLTPDCGHTGVRIGPPVTVSSTVCQVLVSKAANAE